MTAHTDSALPAREALAALSRHQRPIDLAILVEDLALPAGIDVDLPAVLRDLERRQLVYRLRYDDGVERFELTPRGRSRA